MPCRQHPVLLQAMGRTAVRNLAVERSTVANGANSLRRQPRLHGSPPNEQTPEGRKRRAVGGREAGTAPSAVSTTGPPVSRTSATGKRFTSMPLPAPACPVVRRRPRRAALDRAQRDSTIFCLVTRRARRPDRGGGPLPEGLPSGGAGPQEPVRPLCFCREGPPSAASNSRPDRPSTGPLGASTFARAMRTRCCSICSAVGSASERTEPTSFSTRSGSRSRGRRWKLSRPPKPSR